MNISSCVSRNTRRIEPTFENVPTTGLKRTVFETYGLALSKIASRFFRAVLRNFIIYVELETYGLVLSKRPLGKNPIEPVRFKAGVGWYARGSSSSSAPRFLSSEEICTAGRFSTRANRYRPNRSSRKRKRTGSLGIGVC